MTCDTCAHECYDFPACPDIVDRETTALAEAGDEPFAGRSSQPWQEIITADVADVVLPSCSTLVLDPPWHDSAAWVTARTIARRHATASTLVFCGPSNLGDVIRLFDWVRPRWVFTWDTANPWRRGNSYPLQRSKFCVHFGDLYDQRAEGAQIDTGVAASAKHPGRSNTTERALADVFTKSLRWLHNPARGNGTTQRRKTRGGHPAMRHAKPVEWVRALIAATDPTDGLIVDPFAGSGTTLIAARELGRNALGVEIDPDIANYARGRLWGITPAPVAEPDDPQTRLAV